MTTSVKIKPHNYPVKVVISDNYGEGRVTEYTEFLKAGDEHEYYCTTSRTISATDVNYSEVPGSYEAAYPKQLNIGVID